MFLIWMRLGCFLRTQLGKHFILKAKIVQGGKRSKERITVALCSSVTGEKLPTRIIGKAENPRCFSKINKDALPVKYYSNRKAWMTRQILNDWNTGVNLKMKRKNRKILLFIDNASSHEDLDLSHIKVIFFPPNTTTHTQSMGQGIIQAAKLKFRKKQLLNMIKMMDHHTTLSGPDLLKKTSVLDAIYWMNAAWNEVQTSTIQRCFARCGFEEQNKETEETDKDDDDNDGDDDDVPLAALQLTKDIFGCSFSELIDIDSALHTCNTDMQDLNRPASEALNAMDGSPADDSCDDDDDDDD